MPVTASERCDRCIGFKTIAKPRSDYCLIACPKCMGRGWITVFTTQAARLAAAGRHPSNSPFAMQRT